MATWTAAVAMLAATAWAQAAEKIDFASLKQGLAAQKLVLVDVREADEFAAGHVPGAINLPLSRLKVGDVPKPATERVVVMCRSGNRSARAVAALAAAGRDDVIDYAGSYLDWTAKGGPVVTGP
jgi:rhodanese-related sulfurtransferase